MQDLVDRFTIWAFDRPDIRAGIVLGSQARNDEPADRFSDLDLLVIAEDPSIYDRDTWHKGRFLEGWADPVVLQELPSIFAEYTLADVQRALLANLRFYQRFGREVANVLRYDFPDETYSFVVDQVRKLVGEDH